MKKRALSWLLAVVMVVSLAPQTIPWAKAADPASTSASQAKNAFGLTMEEKQAITYGNALKNNPYGTTAWIPLFQDHELVVAGVHDDEFQTTYTGGADGKGSQMSSFRWGHKNYDIGNARRLVNVAFDPYGTGRDEYIATLAFDDDADRLRLYVTNKDRNVVSAIDLCGDDAAFIDKLKFYQTRAMLCIEAGDFDGDGKDTLMVYVPGNNTDTDSVDSIKEYKLADSKLSYTNRKINLGDVLDGGREALKAMLYHNGNGSNELRAHLSVDMAVGDVDMDGVEELAITVNVNDLPKKEYNDKKGHESPIWRCTTTQTAGIKARSGSLAPKRIVPALPALPSAMSTLRLPPVRRRPLWPSATAIRTTTMRTVTSTPGATAWRAIPTARVVVGSIRTIMSR